MPSSPLPSYTTRPLDAETWPDFARLVAAHNGVWGGCWCMAVHPEDVGRDRTAAQNRADKERPGFERTRRIGKTRWVVRKVVG